MSLQVLIAANRLLALVSADSDMQRHAATITAAVDALEQQAAEIARLRAALLDANNICRSAFQIANRIATEYSTNEMGTYFGAFSERANESLKRQHAAILATGGYPMLDDAAREST